jgi:hypothetical protein
MGEADDGRRRHAGTLRDLGDRTQRDVDGMIEHEFGDLLQASDKARCRWAMRRATRRNSSPDRQACSWCQLYPIPAVPPIVLSSGSNILLYIHNRTFIL